MSHFSFMPCHVNISFDVGPAGKEYVLFCASEQVIGRKTLDILAQKMWILKPHLIVRRNYPFVSLGLNFPYIKQPCLQWSKVLITKEN